MLYLLRRLEGCRKDVWRICFYCHDFWMVHNQSLLLSVLFIYSFLKKIVDSISPSCGAIDTPVLDFWWFLPWVSKPGWNILLACLLSEHNRFLRFTSGATAADLLAASMVAEPFHLNTCVQAFPFCFISIQNPCTNFIHDSRSINMSL